MSDCKHEWDIPEHSFGDSYFICRHCKARENVWQRHENAQVEIAALKSLLRECYGYTTAAGDLLPERIKVAVKG